MNNESMNVSILFNEEAHTYLINNMKAKISVTSLIDKQISKTNWAGIDQAVLAKAASRGTAVHKELELWMRDGTEPTTQEAINFKNFVKEKNWLFTNHLEEFKLALEWKSRKNPKNSFILAGTVDLISYLITSEYESQLIADYKTTSTVHTDSVRWQLSILDYIARKMSGCIINGIPFNYKPAEKFFCYHFNKSAEFTPIEVTKISDIEIERLLDAEAEGEEYFPLPQEIITPRQQEELLSVEQQIIQLEQTKKILEEKKKQLTASLLEGFSVHTDITSIKTDSLTISYIRPKETRIFNEKRFIEENPTEAIQYQKSIFDAEAFIKSNQDWANDYTETTTTKPSVRITLSKELKDNIPVLATNTQVVITPKIGTATKRVKAKDDYFK